jgi:hypothetical protein
MRPRTKTAIPNPSASEFENFDGFVRIVLGKGKPKDERPKAKPQARKRLLPRP